MIEDIICLDSEIEDVCDPDPLAPRQSDYDFVHKRQRKFSMNSLANKGSTLIPSTESHTSDISNYTDDIIVISDEESHFGLPDDTVKPIVGKDVDHLIPIESLSYEPLAIRSIFSLKDNGRSGCRSESYNVINSHNDPITYDTGDYLVIDVTENSSSLGHDYELSKIFTCDHCDYKTRWKVNLKKHKEIVHLGIRGFLCNQCSFKSGYKKDLQEHINARHIGLKPHKCNSCGYETSYRKNLRSHFRTKHSEKFVTEMRQNLLSVLGVN